MKRIFWAFVRIIIGCCLLFWISPEFVAFANTISIWKFMFIYLIFIFMYKEKWFE